MVHTSVQKIKQRWQETCKELLTELKYKEAAYEHCKQDSDDPGGTEILSEHAVMGLGQPTPTWISIWEET